MCITEFNKQKFLYDCRREAEEERERAERAEAKARDAETKARDAEAKARNAEAEAKNAKAEAAEARRNAEEEKITFIRNLMKNAHMSAEEAMETIGISTDDFQKYSDILYSI